jgi:hypothetical protein
LLELLPRVDPLLSAPLVEVISFAGRSNRSNEQRGDQEKHRDGAEDHQKAVWRVRIGVGRHGQLLVGQIE